MALAFDVSPLKDFVQGLAGDASARDWAWELGVGAAAVLFGWLVAHTLSKRIRPSARWKFGEGDFERVLYPLLAYAFMALGRTILGRYQNVVLLDIVQSLLVAWIVIRLAVYVLGHVLPAGGFLRASIRAIAWIAWIGVALHVTGLLPEMIGTLDDIGITVGKDKQRITLWLVLQAFAALALTLALAGWISRITETRVLAAQHVEMSTRMVITKLVRVATLFVAVLVALPLVGIDITALSVFSGALGVGLGFGLQKIASNYVSGFIVLLDRSVRIGDLITVDNKRGEVKAIETRYTVIRALDGNEAIIPNELLITQSVMHHTYTDPKVVVTFQVSVGYDSDVDRACELLQAIARHHPRLLDDPAPAARVTRLAESGVDLELAAWIKDPGAGEGDLRSEVFREILRTFRAEGIEIPYPRRDLRIIATAETPESPATSKA